MNTPYFIAKRYFFSNPEKNRLAFDLGFIKIISLIAMILVASVTAALIVVLSAFNGLENLTRSLYSQHNAEIKVSPKLGKTFIYSDSVKSQLEAIPHLKAITQVIEDHALVRYADAQMVVNAKGVSTNFLEQYPLDTAIVEGVALLHKEGINYALVGWEVRYQLNVQIDALNRALQFWYPKNEAQVSMNPAKMFHKKSILPSGIFSVEQQFDKSIIVPLDFMQGLLEYGQERTYLEIKSDDSENISSVQSAIQRILGNGFDVKNADEQQAHLLKAIKIEKLFVTMAFVVILSVAAFGIFATLAILAIEKKKDMAVLQALGGTEGLVRKIFVYEGLLIGITGAVIGIGLGFLACWLQQELGLVSMGVESAIVSSFPVEMHWADFALAASMMSFITWFASILPARKASKVSMSEQL